MNAKENRRNALVPPPEVFLIRPNGQISRIPIATNISTSMVVMDGDTPILAKAKREEGWLMLEDECESKEQYDELLEFFAAERKNPGVMRLDPAKLPKICRERRGIKDPEPSEPSKPGRGKAK